MSLSPIQDHIISILKNAKTMRYSQMRPSETPNDLYNYHLKFLISKNLVQKSASGYSLSPEGIRYVADIHQTGDQSNRLFKICVVTIVSDIQDGQLMILTQQRTSNPSYGKVGVMGGAIIKGEPLLPAASRKLIDKTGLSASFRLVGHERRIMTAGGALFSDVMFPICYADASTGELVDTDFGHNYWTPIDQAIKNESNPHDSIAAITTVLLAIKDGTIASLPLFYTETHQENTLE